MSTGRMEAVADLIAAGVLDDAFIAQCEADYTRAEITAKSCLYQYSRSGRAVSH